MEATLKVYPIIALIILGLILQKFKLFKEDDPAVLKKIINIALSSLLYGAFHQVKPEPVRKRTLSMFYIRLSREQNSYFHLLSLTAVVIYY